VLHVATVHWKDDRWIDIQLAYLKRHAAQPYRTYAFLNKLPEDHSRKFFYSSDEQIKDHATKLNLLGDFIAAHAEDDSDPVLFVDGDAFPIAPLAPAVESLGPDQPLIAVRRAEMGDPQPHPCFCLTTIGFWREIDGDWHSGHKWKNDAGNRVSDVGGNLLGKLEKTGVPWRALERTNKTDLHPLFFGVYGDLAYHHGGGFRAPRGGRLVNADRGLREAKETRRARVLDALPKNRVTRALRRRYHPARRINEELRQETAALSAEVFADIERDPEFWRRFT
jgi:hypothetical protein